MDVNRLRFGEMIAAAAAALLFLVMFLPWYGLPGAFGDLSFDAWESFSWIDLYLLLTILVALGLALLTMTQRTVALPVSASVLVTALAAFAVLLILYRILDQPGENSITETRVGVYLGFLCAAGILAGGLLSMRDEGASFGSAANRLNTQPRPAPPPAPPPSAPPPGATQVSPQPPAPPEGGGAPPGSSS
jgi:hypothetical protein